MGEKDGAAYPPKQVLDHQQFVRQVEFKERLADNVGRILFVASLALPLWMVYLSVDSLAGRITTVNATIGISVTIVVGGAGITALVVWLRSRNQKRELERQRKRIIELEELLNLRSKD